MSWKCVAEDPSSTFTVHIPDTANSSQYERLNTSSILRGGKWYDVQVYYRFPKANEGFPALNNIMIRLQLVRYLF